MTAVIFIGQPRFSSRGPRYDVQVKTISIGRRRLIIYASLELLLAPRQGDVS